MIIDLGTLRVDGHRAYWMVPGPTDAAPVLITTNEAGATRWVYDTDALRITPLHQSHFRVSAPHLFGGQRTGLNSGKYDRWVMEVEKGRVRFHVSGSDGYWMAARGVSSGDHVVVFEGDDPVGGTFVPSEKVPDWVPSDPVVLPKPPGPPGPPGPPVEGRIWLYVVGGVVASVLILALLGFLRRAL